MYAQAINGVWFDVGSPQELIRAQNVLIERRAELPFPLPSGARIENGSFIDPSAEVDVHAVVENSVISANATVGANVVLKHCVLMNGSHVEEGLIWKTVSLSWSGCFEPCLDCKPDSR